MYQKAKESKHRCDAVHEACCFYGEHYTKLGGEPTSVGKDGVDTSYCTESAEIEINPEEEALDEEVEVTVAQAARNYSQIPLLMMSLSSWTQEHEARVEGVR